MELNGGKKRNSMESKNEHLLNPNNLKPQDKVIYENNEVIFIERIDDLMCTIELTGDKLAESLKNGSGYHRNVSIYNLRPKL